MTRWGDKVAAGRAAAGYFLGTLWARTVVARIGSGCSVHWTCQLVWPSHLLLGEGVEIRSGCYFDARSASDAGIEIGDGTRIKQGVFIASYGGSIRLGREVLIGPCSTLLGHGGLSIGDFSMFGPNVTVLAGEHRHLGGSLPYQKQGLVVARTTIGENVYVGANCTILCGSAVGDGCIIGANSLVAGALEGGHVYGGVPARKIKPVADEGPTTGEHRQYQYVGMQRFDGMFTEDDGVTESAPGSSWRQRA